jgi:RNA polymerase sigma factor, sigma-70 family
MRDMSERLPPDADEDSRLLAGIAAGEQAALRRFVDRHGRGLTLFAARYLGSVADAEDAVQDVFVAVWKNAARFDPARGRASTWLYRIAANRCIDLRRWRRFRTFVGLDAGHDTVVAETRGADAALGARQELSIVRDGIAGLPERQRMAILLRAVGDLDVPAIAGIMGTSAGSVEQLLVRARRRLRERLAEVDGKDTTKGQNDEQG